MRVGIVVPVYSGFPEQTFASVEGDTRHVIRWYLHCNRPDPELETQLKLFSHQATVSLALHGWNRGVAISWNAGICESYSDSNDITLVMNDDMHFVPGGFDQFVDFLATSENRDHGLAFLHGRETAGGHAGEVRHQGFACFALGRAAFDQVGAFDENFYPAYSEDIDYALRVRHAGISMVSDPRVLGEHARNRSTREHRVLGGDIERLKAENLAYYARKWGTSEKPNDRPFQYPGFDYRIDWARRHAPYGIYDRPLDFQNPADEVGIVWTLNTYKLRLLAGADVPAETGYREDEEALSDPIVVRLVAHIANRGDVAADADGWVGSDVGTLAIEGFKLEIPVTGRDNIVSYRACAADGVWSRWHLPGEFCGTRGRRLPLTGVEFSLVASKANACLNLRTSFAGGAPLDARGGQQVTSASANERPLVGLSLRIEAGETTLSAKPAGGDAVLELLEDALP